MNKISDKLISAGTTGQRTLLRRWLPLLSGLCFASGLAAAPVETRYTDTEHRFSLTPPPDWTINKQLVPHYPVLVEPTKSPQDEAATIGAYGEPAAKMTLESYVKATRAELAKEKGMTPYGEKSLTLGGAKAYSWRMRVALPNWPVHENRQVFCIHGPQMLILTLTALPINIKKYDAAFDKVIESFRWEPGQVTMPGLPKPAERPGIKPNSAAERKKYKK